MKILLQKIWHRRLSLAHDTFAIPIAWLGAYWLRFNVSHIPALYFSQALFLLPFILMLQILSYYICRTYRGVWRYTSLPDFARIVRTVLLADLLIAVSTFFLDLSVRVPRSIFLLYPMLLLGILAGSRITYRVMKEPHGDQKNAKRVLVIGAGLAGEGLVRDLLRHRSREFLPVGLVDDLVRKTNQEIHGVCVLGQIDQLPTLAHTHAADLIMIAIPSANSAEMRRIVEICEQTKLPFYTLPSLNDLTSGLITVNAVREVSLEDLLGRDPVQLDWAEIHETIFNKVVMVTGGAGSIGSELCRQVAKLSPKQVVILDQSEFQLYQIEQELSVAYPDIHFIYSLGDVQDADLLQQLFSTYQPELVFHAAAYKHVPLLEHQPFQAITNNIIGTFQVAKAACQHKVKKFVLISTDKAVNPTNIMGATKRVAELLCQYWQHGHETSFITVRFGNVIGSTGSVVPLFRAQLQRGGPLTVTHPDITRYFMTIPEAAQLILQACAFGQPGEIFVLDMGEPVKISYLAEQMIRLAGKQPEKDIAIQYIGLRPGEKLHEELFQQTESKIATHHEKILRVKDDLLQAPGFIAELETVIQACKQKNLDILMSWIDKIRSVEEVG